VELQRLKRDFESVHPYEPFEPGATSAREVDMVDIEEARALAEVSPQALRHSAGTQGWHLLESGDG
jgi:hypothetical protein